MNVTFRLTPTPVPKLSYTDLRAHFAGKETARISEIREAILSIRRKKFPDWKVVGTAGSFFKNPTISPESFSVLRKQYPNMPGYPGVDGSVKVPLGWVLDKICNLRGYAEGNVRLYEAQALVLVCERGASATEIDTFAHKVVDIVQQKTGIAVEREVSVLG